MKKIPYNDFREKLQTEDIYFINTFENAAVRSVITEDGLLYFVKLDGEDEFLTKSDSKLVANAILEHTILTKEEYDNF